MRVQISAGRALKERAVYTIGPGPVCKCTGQCTLEGSVQDGGVQNFFCYFFAKFFFCTLGVQNFFKLFLKLTNLRQPKVTCLVHH